jgi:predicted O-methyltransferase YrrM
LHAQLEYDGRSVALLLYADNQTWFQSQSPDELLFRIPRDKAAYLVTNPSGRTHAAPSHAPFSLSPNCVYSLRAQIACDSCQDPSLWIFDYGGKGRVQTYSYPTKAGAAEAIFRTSADHHRAAFAIRITGKGRLHPEGIRFQLSSGRDAEQRYLDEQLEHTKNILRNEHAKQQQDTLAQLENFVRLQTYMGSEVILPPMHGWPISPDLGVLLIRLLEAQRYDAVIEFGSGVSTLIIARALQRIAARHKCSPSPLLSLEHLEHYHAQTRAHLAAAGLKDHLHIALAPLVPYEAANGQRYPYYDLDIHLSALSRQLSDHPQLFVLVDGPPAATRRQARYPALPVLLDRLPSLRRLDILMDDYRRDDERAIIQQWESLAQACGLRYQREEYLDFDKQACLLSLERNDNG